MKRRKKNKRKAPKRARVKAHSKMRRSDQTETGASPVEFSYASPLSAPPLPPVQPAVTVPPLSPVTVLSTDQGLVTNQDLENHRREREEIERMLLEKIEGLRAKAPVDLDKLRNVGLDEREIVIRLAEIRAERMEKRKKLTAVPGVPFDKIKALPGLLKKIAGQIDAINEHGYSLTSDQMLMLMLSPRLAGIYLGGKRLPGSMRVYAYALSARLGTLKTSRKTGRIDPDTPSKVQLVHYVREKAGEPHYDAVAALINAFNKMEDEKAGFESREVTGRSLKELWEDHKDFRESPEPPNYPPVDPIGPIIRPTDSAVPPED